VSTSYSEAENAAHAVDLATRHGPSAAFVAGGTDLVVLARKRREPLPPVLIGIHRIPELRRVGETPDGGLRIGAGVSHAVLETHPAVVARYPALADGAAIVGSPATRNAGTLGGNLANASPAADTASPLLAFGATVELLSAAGARELPLAGFLRGPGQTAAGPGELVTAVRLPAPPEGGAGSAYLRLDYRLAMEIAVVGAAARVTLAGGRITGAAVALTAVAPACVVARGAAERLRGREPTEETLQEAAAAAAAAASPIDDIRAEARYRQAMIPVIVYRALRAALARARGEHIPVPATLSLAVQP
jgi:CO/xanthine dehydrogenase FAD-binding subunit